MGEAVESWRQEGRVSVWRYRKARKMYDGWHFAADQKGCASLVRLLDLLSAVKSPAYRTVVITDPRGVGADRIFGDHNLQIDVPVKLRLSNDLDGGSAIGLSADAFVMPLRPEDIASLSDAVRDLANDHADFGVALGRNETIVKFWWWPTKCQAS